MFGYVLPVKQELKVCDFELYRALYCGLCKQLGKEYQTQSRLLLNYDLVLLALIADALSGEKGDIFAQGCFINPINKRWMRHNTSGLSLAADALILLSYYRLKDHLQDESGGKKMLYSLGYPTLHHKHRRAAARQPALDAILAKQMQHQRELEAGACADIDQACEPTGQMSAALFAAASQNDEHRHILKRLGLFAGQIVYLLDAAEDFEQDAKTGRYNVFLCAKMEREEAIQAVQRRCRMAAGELALCYNLLQFKQYKNILDNIFYLGLPRGIAAAGQKRTARRTGHGQIESL